MRWAAALPVLVGALLTVGACGVEVPDDAVPTTPSTAATREGPPSTTAPPTSDDDLEQALIGYGYTEEEAACGAENLREVLDDQELSDLVAAESVEAIPRTVPVDFADALRPCVESGSDDGSSTTTVPDDPSGTATTAPDPSDPMPELPDDGSGDVTRTRFFAALVAGGYDVAVARCVVDAIYEAFDQATINEVFRTESLDDLPPEVGDEVEQILITCS